MSQASIEEDDNKVDGTTVQWAREALQRRRKEMRQQKEDLIASYKQDVVARDSVSLNSNAASPTHSMIERGKMILAETEARSEILSRYASFQNSILTTPTSTPQHHTIASNLPIQSPYSLEEGDVACEEVGSSDDEEILTEDEARAQLQELIATINHNRGGDDGLEQSENNTITIKNFDPSSMNTAKVAAQRKAKFDEALAAAAAESQLMTSFKALPLPSGAEVKHNIFAPTQAFQGKQVMGGRDVKYGPTTNDNNCNYAPSTLSESSSFRGGALDDSLSVLTSATSHDDDDSYGAASSGVLIVRTEADKERAKQLMADRKMKKKQILDEVDRIVMGGDANTPALFAESTAAVGTNGAEASCDIMSVVVEDPSKLLQDIAHLKAKLKQKKTDRLAILNDIVDIDLNAPFDRLIPGTVVGDEIWCIIDRLKKRVCGGIADYDSNHAYSSNLPHKLSASSLSKTTNNLTPIFIRQQQWAKQREQKLLNARLQQEADAMDGITGVPQISDATQSWKRARESHDESLRRVAEEDAKKHQAREAKEKALREELAKETENKEVEVAAAKTLITNEADNEERRKRIELLARPRQVRAAFAASMESCSSKDEEYEQHQHPPMDLPSKSKIFLSPKPKKKKKKQMTRAILSVHDEGRTDLASSSEYPPSNLTSAEKKPDKFCGMNSFAEMSDKEFAKLIKNIGKGQVSFLSKDE
jgi:hypothetical protein